MSLPFCHSRRELPTTPGVMYCVHPRVHVDGYVVRVEICRLCDYWKEPSPDEFKPFPPPPPRGWCDFLGDVIGMRDCPTCSGTVRLKVFACAHPDHTDTTWDACLRCPDHRESGTSQPTGVVDG